MRWQHGINHRRHLRVSGQQSKRLSEIYFARNCRRGLLQHLLLFDVEIILGRTVGLGDDTDSNFYQDTEIYFLNAQKNFKFVPNSERAFFVIMAEKFFGGADVNFLRELWEALIYFLFPPRCPVCREIVDERYQICSKCAGKILRVDSSREVHAPIDRVLRVTKYRGGSRELLHKLKFNNDLTVVPVMKKILDDATGREEILSLLRSVDCAVPVPLNQDRLDERGFNQTEEIFGEWLATKNLPLKNILKRTQSTPKLYSLGKAEREKILSGVFAPIEPIDLRGQKILLVDDIFTTGTTCKECAKVLKSLGASKVFVLAFASDFGEHFKRD